MWPLMEMRLVRWLVPLALGTMGGGHALFGQKLWLKDKAK
jgi:hypothetical protein